MEVITRQVCLNEKTRKILHQFQLNEEVNVPDSKEDVVRIVKGEMNVIITDTQPMEEYVKISGKIKYCILYMTDNMDNRISCIEGEIPFEEMIFVEGKEHNRYYAISNGLEFQPSLIHSRKIGMKALVELVVEKTGGKIEEVTQDVEGDLETSLHKKMKTIPILQTISTAKDTYRIKEQVKIAGSKENIGNILYSNIESYKIDFKVGQDEIVFNGEMQVFCIYLSEEWKEDWMNQTVAIRGRVDCYGIDEEKYHNIHAVVEELSVEPQPDEDGEMRMIGIETTLRMDVEILEEEEVEVLEDLYALEKRCDLETKEITVESLLLQSQSKCKVVENLNLPELSEEIIQICHSTGIVQIESVEVLENEIMVEGILNLSFLYATGIEEKPFASWKGMIPFSHSIECKGGDELHFNIQNNLEQLCISMAGNKEIEVRAVIGFQCMIKKPEKITVIEKIEMEEYTKEEMENQASITGYIYKDGDDLWNLAKKYHTTQNSIMEINGITEKEVKPGTRLLIFKENMSIL